MKEEKIIARVFPYNHEYENTKNLETFLNYLDNDIKKQCTDSRTIIARYNKKKLPEGTYILFLYDKKIRGYVILESQKKDYLKYDSLVLLEQIRVIDKTRLISYVGKLSEKEISNINSAIVDTFDFDLIDYLKSYGIGGNYEKKKNLYSDYYSK